MVQSMLTRNILKCVLATGLVGGVILATAATASADAIITNGTVALGVLNAGELGVPGNPAGGSTEIEPSGGTGVSYIRSGVRFEYTYSGCVCEGWGAGDATTGMYGGADVSTLGGTIGVTPISFASTATTATSVVQITGSPLTVTQDYHPSSGSVHLYEDTVTLTNTGTTALANVEYVRTMDWDVEPTAFDEFVTIGGLPASALNKSNDNGFSDPRPNVGPTGEISPGTTDTNFTHVGPADHGAYFRFDFGTLAPGASTTFDIFYGGDDSVSAALADLSSVLAEVYSLGEPDRSTTDPGYSVAIFGFKGVGGTAVGGAVPEPATLTLVGLGAFGLVRRFRRKTA